MKLKSVVKLTLFKMIGYISKIFYIRNNKIVIDNFYGRGFGDNPKYIVKQLLKLNPSLDIVWLINNKADLQAFPPKVRLVKYYSFRSAYELATAHIWIDNTKNNYKGEKRKGQFYLQTWHGGIGFKKVEKATEETLDEEYIRASKRDSKQTDLMISDSKWVTNNYRTNFWYAGKIANTGFPRNDIFFHNLENTRLKVKNFYGIDQDTEIILYAPTFRNYISIQKQGEICSFNAQKVVQAFEKRFNKKFVLVKRMHPNVADRIPITESNNVKDGSKYPDMQELLVASFALITDFSSSAFDFMLKSDKIFLFANDYDQYIAKDRMLEFNIKKDLPFSFSNNENELLANINSFSEQIAQKKLNSFKKQVALHEDGHASERVANLLLKKMKK